MNLLADATLFIETASKTIPLIPFLFWASLVEELVAPIPAFFVAVVAAPIVHAAGYSYVGIFALACVSSVGKTLASWIYYVLGDKAEDWVTGKWGRVLGISHESLENWGPKVGKGWKDEIVLTILRTIPFIPSAPISVLAGVVKVKLRSYLGATFFGYTLRNFALLTLAYEGLDWWKSLIGLAEETNSSLTSFLVIGIILAIAWSVWKGKHQTMANDVREFFRSFRNAQK